MNNHLAEQFNNKNLVCNIANANKFPSVLGDTFSGVLPGSNIPTSESFGLFRHAEGATDLMPILSGDDVVGGRFSSPVSSPDIQTPNRIASPDCFDNNTQNTLCERAQAIKIEQPLEAPLNTLNAESVWSIFPHQIPQSPTATSSISSTPQHDQPTAVNGFKFDIAPEEREGVGFCRIDNVQ